MTPQRSSQFTSKMKANADSRLLSSLVRIDLYNERNRLTALIIFAKMHFLLISENELFHEIKLDGITSLHGFHDVKSCEVTVHEFKRDSAMRDIITQGWFRLNEFIPSLLQGGMLGDSTASLGEHFRSTWL